jgi:hypothetical protein
MLEKRVMDVFTEMNEEVFKFSVLSGAGNEFFRFGTGEAQRLENE